MHRRASFKLCDGEGSITRPQLAVLTLTPDTRINSTRNPIRHISIVEYITDWIKENGLKIRDEFHAVSHLGFRYIGLFHIKGELGDIEWMVGITNNNDGKAAVELHSGFTVPAVEDSIGFHKSFTVTDKRGSYTPKEIRSLVNENMSNARQLFNVEHERIEIYKKLKLTPEKAHHIICLLIQSEIVAGRLSFETLIDWNDPKVAYLKPRTLWSLFVHCLTFINRLRTIHHIERSKALQQFFDELAGFVPKPTKWVQQTLC